MNKNDYYKGYIAGIDEQSRAMSHMSLWKFISWRRKTRNKKEIQEMDKKIKIGQLEGTVQNHCGKFTVENLLRFPVVYGAFLEMLLD